jgi:hypothetical protein
MRVRQMLKQEWRVTDSSYQIQMSGGGEEVAGDKQTKEKGPGY